MCDYITKSFSTFLTLFIQFSLVVVVFASISHSIRTTRVNDSYKEMKNGKRAAFAEKKMNYFRNRLYLGFGPSARMWIMGKKPDKPSAEQRRPQSVNSKHKTQNETVSVWSRDCNIDTTEIGSTGFWTKFDLWYCRYYIIDFR